MDVPEDLLYIVLVVASGYLAGSIPTSLIIGRLFFKTDIRRHGSGNAGATNAFRVFGWKAGVPAILLDAGKGVFAVLVISQLAPPGLPPVVAGLIAGVSAVIGHIWTVFARFRGGKGVATAAGMVGALHPLGLAIAVAAFAVTLLLSGYVSLGSLVGALVFPLAVVALDFAGAVIVSPVLLSFTVVVALVIIFTHRVNIRRLLSGTENRFEKLMVFRTLLRRGRSREKRERP